MMVQLSNFHRGHGMVTDLQEPKTPIEENKSDRHVASSTARVTGDELFVPASHVLVTDRRVSHPAFRLWCVLHRLWFLHEPPTMELLQELMGTSVEEKRETEAQDSEPIKRPKVWQPATRRSIERWLHELEVAGW